MFEITKDSAWIWQIYIQMAGMAGLIGGGIGWFVDRWRERKMRRQELSWRKTQFLVELGERFDQDEDIRRAQVLIDGDAEALKRLCTTGPESLSSVELEDRHALERYLDFFDRLYAYVVVTQTLTVEETMMFSGWLDVLEGDGAPLRHLARTRGYVDVIRLYNLFQKWIAEWNRKHPPAEQTGTTGSTPPTLLRRSDSASS